MMSEDFRFITEDRTEIFVHKWLPAENVKPKAVVQISHGMAEHSERYERFAKTLVDADYAVYANDHRGHGKTAGSLEKHRLISRMKTGGSSLSMTCAA